MKRLHEVITVAVPQAKAFRYTSDFSNIEQWDPGVVASCKTSAGPVAEGSRFKVVVKTGLTSTTLEYEVLRFDPPHRIVLEGRGGNIHAVDDIRFSPVEGGTCIEYTAEIDLGGAVAVVEPLLGPALERVGRKAVAGLKDALDRKPELPSESIFRNLADRLVLPGALGFTRYGYAAHKRGWKPLATSMEGRTVVVTGATSGLGRVTAERLAGMGARVALVGRNRQKLDTAIAEIASSTGSDSMAGYLADLSLMSEVRLLAEDLLEKESSIDVLVNNAAVLPGQRVLTGEGLESAFATNLLSPYLLTNLLLPALKASAPSRIVNVLSGGMYLSGIDTDDLQNASGIYTGSRAYARAKRGLMILTEQWADELKDSGVAVNAMHPGWADTPGVQDSLPGFHKLTRRVLRTPEEGADTIVWLAAAAEAGDVSGKLWLDREPHLSSILPGTAGDPRDRERLVQELDRLAA